MSKVKGTVKWFNNRKGYGFITPTTENSPTEEDIFVHQTSIFSGDEYRTLKENVEVEFDVEKEESGKFKAVNVTAPGGGPLKPPPKREPRVKTEDSDETRETKENSDDNAEKTGRGNRRGGGRGGRGKKSTGEKKVDPPFHDVIADEVKEQIDAAGIELSKKNTIDVALGGARIKLGRGGYCGYCSSDAIVAEGTYTCDEQGVVTFDWKLAIEYSGDKWIASDISQLMPTLSLVAAGIGPVGVGETPETLWGADKVDPREAFEEQGFQMRRVVLTRPPDSRGRRGNGGAKKVAEQTE